MLTKEDFDTLELLRRSREDMGNGRYRTIREHFNLTQADVGKMIGTGPASIAGYEHGRRHPRGESALKYARLMEELARRMAKTS